MLPTRSLTRLLVLLVVAAGLAAAPPVHAQSPSTPPSPAVAPVSMDASAALPDRAAVRQAALDYVEALYEVDTARVVRSVHPELVKYGYYRRDGAYRGSPMTYDELKALAARWNRDHRRVDSATAPKEVVVFEVLDKTASAKVVAEWGTDYMHLAKIDGRWKIQQILWQSPPPAGE